MKTLVRDYGVQTSTPVNRLLSDKLKEFISAEDYGWADPTKEPGKAMNDAISAAIDSGCRVVKFHSSRYDIRTPIVLKNGVFLKGTDGSVNSTLGEAPGAKLVAVVMTEDFVARYNGKFASSLNGSARDCGLIDVSILGNKNKPGAPTVTDAFDGIGFAFYGHRPYVYNLRIHEVRGIALWSAYFGNTSRGAVYPPGYSFKDNLMLDIKDHGFFNISINDCGYEGFAFEGPSDIRIDNFYVGWPGNSLPRDGRYQSSLRSKRFTNGGVVHINVTNGGTGYSATPTVTVNGGVSATAVATVVGGSISHIDVTYGGKGYSTDTTTVTITDPTGTGATAVPYCEDLVCGVVMKDGADVGYMHIFNADSGAAVNLSGDDYYARYNFQFLMAESSLSNLWIGSNARYQIAQLDTHQAGWGGGSGITGFSEVHVTSTRGGTIASWDAFNNLGDDDSKVHTFKAPYARFSGQFNRVDARIFAFNRSGTDGIVANGDSLDITANISGLIAGYGITLNRGMVNSRVNLTTRVCSASIAYRGTLANPAIKASVTTMYRAGGLYSQFSGLDTLSPAAYRGWSIDAVSESKSEGYSNRDIVSNASIDNTLLTQDVTLNHRCIRAPQFLECTSVLQANSGSGVPKPMRAAFVSSTTSTVTYRVNAQEAGTGTSTLTVSINC